MNTILKMQNVSKSFGGVHALVDVHLTVGRGEIHALMGENGAGKSTLMNVLTGVIPMDKGTIEFDGKEYPRPTIRQMEEAGIAFGKNCSGPAAQKHKKSGDALRGISGLRANQTAA